MTDKDFSEFETALTASFSGFAKCLCIIIRLCFGKQVTQQQEFVAREEDQPMIPHSQVAAMADVTTETIRNMFDDNKIPGAFRKSSRTILIPEDVAEQIVAKYRR